MGDVLFLAHRIPYPPDKGDKIRSWNMLRHIAGRAKVHLGAFVDDPADMAHEGVLRELCGDVLLRPLKRFHRPLKALRAFRNRDALSLAFFHDEAMVSWVRDTVRRHRIDAIFVFSSQMAPYAMPYLGGRHSVMDFVDVDSEKWRQYADEARGLKHIVYDREAKLLRDYEKLVVRHFGSSLFVSEAEAALFRKIAGSFGYSIAALSNGVDLAHFDPQAGFDRIDPLARPSIVFTGAMDYRPNIDAVTWFADKVWPLVRSRQRTALFSIVGSNPTPEVRRLGAQAGIEVTGRVPDIRPYIDAADVAVAPLRIARGIQNKVLEAMAMAKPVVATPAALEGIEATPRLHLLVEDDPVMMAKAILALLDNPERAREIGLAARRQMEARYDWGSNLAALDAMLGLDSRVRSSEAIEA